MKCFIIVRHLIIPTWQRRGVLPRDRYLGASPVGRIPPCRTEPDSKNLRLSGPQESGEGRAALRHKSVSRFPASGRGKPPGLAGAATGHARMTVAAVATTTPGVGIQDSAPKRHFHSITEFDNAKNSNGTRSGCSRVLRHTQRSRPDDVRTPCNRQPTVPASGCSRPCNAARTCAPRRPEGEGLPGA